MTDDKGCKDEEQENTSVAPSTSEVRVEPDAIVMDGVRLTDPAVVEYVRSIEASDRVAAVAQLVAIGVSCMGQAVSQQDVDRLGETLQSALEQAVKEAGVVWGQQTSEQVRRIGAEILRPIRDGVRQLVLAQARLEERQNWLDRTPRKGDASEEHLFRLLNRLEVERGGRVLRTSKDGKVGDFLLFLPSIGRPGHEDIIAVELKNGGRAVSWKVLSEETHRAMEARDADACIWVNMEDRGFSTEVGPYSIGDNELGPWTATVVDHLMMAILHTQIRLHAAYLQQVRPDVDRSLIEACLRRIDVAVSRMRTVRAQVGKIVASCESIQKEVWLVERDAKAAIRDAMEALQKEGA